MDLDKIIQKAQNEKDKKARNESNVLKQIQAKESSFQRWRRSLFPYRLFRKFNYRGTTWLFFLSLALASTCYFIPFDDFPKDSIFPKLLTYTSIVSVLVFIALFLGVEIYTVIRYSVFKNLPASIGFELQGWESAIEKKEFMDYENWWLKCSLTIELNESAKTDLKAVQALEALCFLTNKACNRQFYSPFMSETRSTWTTNDLKMNGSANVYVFGVLHEFLYRKLKALHNHTGIIKKVTLTGDTQFCYVSRETSD